MNVLINGNPLDKNLACGRLRSYRDLIAYYREHPEQIENINVARIIGDGLFGGLRPEEIATELKSLGVEAERVDRLVSRNVDQWNFTY